MGIFRRVKMITNANIHELLDGVEDPIAMLNEYSREMEQEMAKAQKALSRQIFIENKQAKLINETKEIIAKRTRQANLALDFGEEAIARMAIEEKIMYENYLGMYELQYAEIQEQSNMLKEQLKELQNTFMALQNRKLLLASRANVARSMKQIQSTTASFQTGNILKGISQAEDQILLMESEVQANRHFTSPMLVQDVIYQNHVNDEDINQEIEKLKNEKEKQLKLS
ncbi:PspA/IM30 family protein [Ureibacillus aquaedulcis]|uniref:PspA/IM30 family protein n=1 Tax=Ureibacillus aquaedulcis TaxID=3058421 RepID=A0ABT8GSF5_9BACL|nr:PspA/IM30 family protein [Ureibacillus sp. BA0131]MDN4494334.1 PspA/IM30 family protein [Ureibacillus sp. BA0131]